MARFRRSRRFVARCIRSRSSSRRIIPSRRMLIARTESPTARPNPSGPRIRTRSSPPCSRLLIADSTPECFRCEVGLGLAPFLRRTACPSLEGHSIRKVRRAFGGSPGCGNPGRSCTPKVGERLQASLGQRDCDVRVASAPGKTRAAQKSSSNRRLCWLVTKTQKTGEFYLGIDLCSPWVANYFALCGIFSPRARGA